MNENETNETSETKTQPGESEEQRVRSEAQTAVAIDLPRMVRSDVTRLTEMIAKYHTILGAEGVVAYLLDARAALLAYTPGSGLEFVGGAAEFMREGEIPDFIAKRVLPRNDAAVVAAGDVGALEFDSGGRDALVTAVLVSLGVLSSTARARLAIRDGVIKVDGKPVTQTGALLAPGKTYKVTVGDDDGWQGQIAVR